MTAFESGHLDQVHDAQLDYYGRRLATCSSDKTVKVFEIVGDKQAHLADLRGHEGPVWQVCWAHPKFGSLLASCSFDHRVIVWKEAADNLWQQVYITPGTLHTASINSIAWAPHELGLLLAAASSDGTISITEYSTSTGSWDATKLPGSHPIGVTAVSWSPAIPAGALVGSAQSAPNVKRLVTSGCDNTIRIWRCAESTGLWQEEETLPGHSDWVRDVAWAPNMGLPRSTIASAGQDGQVFAWCERVASAGGQGGWEKRLVHDFKVPVWRVSWSTTGSILAVSDANSQVTLWKESVDGLWKQVPH
ncbi:WD40-repeat-containing domain protein [Dunaliella salina]|uniref:WD40-repeat-containing domain protein n=1 Tax=Dunaliella salina TaxID=3046 RepID=A0ABQ7H0I9_DUNSA|nr:WD40-repeat-containing domain protein [Dunaliella salina]|eukprot:KAF5840365.1 WD40-repeat-containing domain protein [Dunaliella salina]